ncbi:hypothetical protein PTKIN_Ptkin12aG0178300 [Pterospermum kingtungense]
MGIQDKYEAMAARQSYKNVWHTTIMKTMQADFPYCLYAACCGQCVSYTLRKRALHNDMSRYECCGGYMPCSGKFGESQCPEFCLCTEVFCCFTTSVTSTRFLLQDELNIQTTKCDNCIIGFMFCLGQFACIFRLIAIITGSDELEDASEILNCFTDAVFCTVCACMQVQHKIEMDKRDGKFGPPPVMMLPPVQQMSRMNQPAVHPAVGHPPQPGQWQPPYVYGCPPSIPLPPPGYPAHAHAVPPPGCPPTGYQLPAPCPRPPKNFPPSEYPSQGYHK